MWRLANRVDVCGLKFCITATAEQDKDTCGSVAVKVGVEANVHQRAVGKQLNHQHVHWRGERRKDATELTENSDGLSGEALVEQE